MRKLALFIVNCLPPIALAVGGSLLIAPASPLFGRDQLAPPNTGDPLALVKLLSALSTISTTTSGEEKEEKKTEEERIAAFAAERAKALEKCAPNQIIKDHREDAQCVTCYSPFAPDKDRRYCEINKQIHDRIEAICRKKGGSIIFANATSIKCRIDKTLMGPIAFVTLCDFEEFGNLERDYNDCIFRVNKK
jgi:hypothetical protein